MKNYLIMEIRQGIGGLESIEFVKNLYNMYVKFLTKNNIKYEILLSSIKEIILKISNSIYNNLFLKESGIHRVQRIPKTETQGRLHTSTCTVFVSYFINENYLFNLNDIKFEVCKSGGAGGQHVNKTNSSIKIIHLPTKITIECSDERSLLSNKNKAITILKFKLSKLNSDLQTNALNKIRKSVISNSTRSKKIRTYNYHNKKIINHITLKSYYKFDEILNGYLFDIIN